MDDTNKNPDPSAPKRPRRRGNLRDKVALYFLLVSIVPLLAMGYIVVHLVEVTSNRTVSELEKQLVRQKSREVEKFFEETTGVFDVRIPFELSDIAIAPKIQRDFLLQETLAVSRAVERVSLFDLSGKEVSRAERERTEVPDRELIDGSLLEKFRVAKEGRPYFSPIHYTLDGVRMSVARPVINSAGVVIGVLAGEITLKPLERAMSFAVLGNTGYLLLVADSGELVAGSLKDTASHPILSGISIMESLRSGAAITLSGSAEAYTSFWGERVFGFGERVRGLPLFLVAEWPEDDALTLAQEIRFQALILSLFMLFAVFLMSILVARRVTQPIQLLQKEAKIIGEGRFDETISIRTNDEIEQLDEELHEMAKALKTLHQLREEFVFIAAHELRAPVTAIKGYISMVLEEGAEKLAKDTREMLEQVQKANQHLVQLVQDLLEVARSDAGRMKVETSPQNLVTAIKTVVSDLKPLWQERGIRVEYAEPPAPIPQVLADPDKLHEVLVNLASNAIKYNREGGLIGIGHEVSDNMVVTRVRDTGIGMTPEEISKLFGKFYRAENTDTRKVQGTGLGLFIVKQIIEKMGGKIWVESERGKGSIFSFSLPVA